MYCWCILSGQLRCTPKVYTVYILGIQSNKICMCCMWYRRFHELPSIWRWKFQRQHFPRNPVRIRSWLWVRPIRICTQENRNLESCRPACKPVSPQTSTNWIFFRVISGKASWINTKPSHQYTSAAWALLPTRPQKNRKVCRCFCEAEISRKWTPTSYKCGFGTPLNDLING